MQRPKFIIRNLLLVFSVAVGIVSAKLTSYSLSGLNKPGIATDNSSAWFPEEGLETLEIAGNVWHLYHWMDDLVVWRERIKARMKLQTTEQLVEHLLPASLRKPTPPLRLNGLFVLGVDVDGFGKQGDVFWAFQEIDSAPVILDGSTKFVDDPERRNWRLFPVDRRWCNSVSGRILDLISE